MIPGHLDEKVAGNGYHNKTTAEVSTNLRRRPFFLVFTRIAAALQMRLDSTAKASTHATFYSLNATLYPTPNKKQPKLKFFNVC